MILVRQSQRGGPDKATCHPSLDIDVSPDFRAVSLERRETDIALRLGRPNDGEVIAKLVATLGFGFYTSAKWTGQPEAGAPPIFVGFDEANSALPEAVWLLQHFIGREGCKDLAIRTVADFLVELFAEERKRFE